MIVRREIFEEVWSEDGVDVSHSVYSQNKLVILTFFSVTRQ